MAKTATKSKTKITEKKSAKATVKTAKAKSNNVGKKTKVVKKTTASKKTTKNVKKATVKTNKPKATPKKTEKKSKRLTAAEKLKLELKIQEQERLIAEKEERKKKEAAKKKRASKLDKKIQKIGSDANRSLSRYLQEIGKFEPLEPIKEVDLAIRVKKGDRMALKELTEANLRFVVSVAKDYQGQGLPLTDLINEGNLGLIKAAERFDETRGFKFISYAVWWIRQSVLQALAEHSRIVRLPLNRVGTISKINKAAQRLEQEFERPPREDELAKQLDMGAHEVTDAVRISRRHHSLDTPFSDEDNNCLLDVIPDNKQIDPDKDLMMDSLKQEIRAALNTLKERERDVIRMYFGIDHDYALTLNEIGEEFDLTRERVRQIKEKAIRRLRHRSRSKKLRMYLG